MERNEEFYQTAGFNAYRLGLTSFNCPYPGKSKEGRAWLEGYSAAKRMRARKLEVNQIVIRKPIASRMARAV